MLAVSNIGIALYIIHVNSKAKYSAEPEDTNFVFEKPRLIQF